MIGLVKIGLQSRADRYTYIPLIGLSIAVAWGVASIVRQHRWLAVPIAGWACAIFAATFVQTGTWKNSTTLFAHAIAVTKDNYVAQNNLGVSLREPDQRMAHFEEAIRLRPDYPEAQNNLGQALLSAGRLAEAIPHINEALRLQPNLPEAHVNMGAVREQEGRPDLAESEYRTALKLKPFQCRGA